MNRACVALLLASLAAPVDATTLDDAIAAALAHDPSITIADAGREAAGGRVTQAKSAGLPTVTVRGSLGYGRLDPQGFFGLGGANVTPLTAQASIEQPLFSGGRVAAAVAQARAGLAVAEAGRINARGDLAAAVADAYGNVLTSTIMVASWQRLLAQTSEIERQARLRYKAGESPDTEVAQASARLAEARGGLAGAEGAVAAARAHYRNLVGDDPLDLAPLPAGPPAPPTLDEAVALAAHNSAGIAQAEAGLAGARAASRGARAERLPTVGAFAEAGRVSDQFFPDYRANAATVGVRANWQLYNGGRVAGRITETNAEVRVAEARLRAARQQVEEQVVTLFQGLRTAQLIAIAAADQARASEQARISVAHEVRVGMKPQFDLLDAEREAIASTARAAQADAARVTTAYRLSAALGRED
ncbi:MAG: channel protein TolC [Alphaproteobacteria bacterium]|nr:MAG: channel protein TolC [Alphaproteobacteria bacterium]